MSVEPEINDKSQSLREALLEKEQIQGFMLTLERLKADGSVNDEQYATLKSGYHEKMMAAVSEIGRIKHELADQLLSLKQSLNYCKTDLKQLKIKHDSGELSLSEYQSSEKTVSEKIEGVRMEIACLQRLLEAKASAQIARPSITEHPELVAVSEDTWSRTTQIGETPKAISSVNIATGKDLKSKGNEELESLYESADIGQMVVNKAAVSGDKIQQQRNKGGLMFRRVNIMLSLVVAAAIFLGILLTGEDVFDWTPTVGGAICAYAFWSWWWGLQLLWPAYYGGSFEHWRELKGLWFELRHAFLNLKIWRVIKAVDGLLMRLVIPFFFFPFYYCLAMVVGIFGGGIYKFVKYVRAKDGEAEKE